MAVATGSYTGNGSAKSISTGLTNVKAVHIIRPTSGKSMIAYTTDGYQAFAGATAFMQNTTPAAGIAIQSGGVIAVTHANWICNGEQYAWEARN